MAKVCINSCGLSVDSDGNLGVDTGSAVWSFTCAETKGGKVYCSEADGHLHTDPPVVVLAGESTGGSTGLTTALPQNVTVSFGDATASIVNPSSCWSAQALIVSEFDYDVNAPPGGRVRSFMGADRMSSWANKGSSTVTGGGFQTAKGSTRTLTPGQTLPFTVALEIEGSQANGIICTRVQWRIHWIIVAGPSS